MKTLSFSQTIIYILLANYLTGKLYFSPETFTMEDGIPITQICVEKTNDDGYLKQWAGPLMCDDKNLISQYMKLRSFF